MEYKNFAIELARHAGAIIKKNFSLNMAKEWKQDNTPLTQTDLEINSLVVKSIKDRFPNHGIISEESEADGKEKELVWICDPLDGTVPFSHGVPTSVFSIALVKEGKSILGVVHDPYLDRMFYAEKGKGAWLNDQAIHVSDKKILERSLVGVLPWSDAKWDITKTIKKLIDRKAGTINVLSNVYMDMLVASGEFVGQICISNKPWDSAASNIIIEEAGGEFTDIFGNEIDYRKEVRGHLSTNGYLHKELLTIIKEAFGE